MSLRGVLQSMSVVETSRNDEVSSPSIGKIRKAQKKERRKAFVNKILERLRALLLRSPVTSVLLLSLLTGVVINAVVGSIAWQKFVVEERDRQLEVLAEQHVRAAAQNISNYLRDIEQRLAPFAENNSVDAALRSNNEAGLQAIEDAMREAFPHALAIRFFRVGEAQLDLTGDPPLRFSELENIRRAERREEVIPEALNAGGNGWSFSVVAAVPKDPTRPAVGTVMITLPFTEVYQSMRRDLSGVGKVALHQVFGDNRRLVGSFGEGELYQAELVAVSGSPWLVEFTASDSLFNQTRVDHTALLLVGSVAALASLAFFMFVGLIFGRRIYRSQKELEETHRRMGRVDGKARGKDGDDWNVNILAEDKDLLGLSDDVADLGEVDPLDIRDVLTESEAPEVPDNEVPDHIFRCYDIRGLAEDEIDDKLAQRIGQALGSEALEKGEHSLIVARDARTHGPTLTECLIRGVLSTGCNVLNIGTVPTPILYFATETLTASKSGVMVTASHNPAAYNGFKVVMSGQTRTEGDIKAVRSRILKNRFRKGVGKEEQLDIVNEYIEAIFSDVALAGDMTIVIDAANGVTGKVAPQLFEELGCEVVPLHCELDGTFPNHGPDPSVEANLQDLILKVKEVGANLGVAFDGDGDRLAVVTPTGKIIWPDRLLMLFAKDILARNPGGDVVFDVKSSRQLNQVVSSNGGRPIMWKTGHAPMRAKVFETGALIGGEFSGHIFIRDRWHGFDDGMYVAARLIEIMSLRDEPLDEIFEEFPELPITPEIRIDVPEERKFELVQQLVNEGDFGDAKLITLDGLRAEYSYGWGLIRASNTSAHLTMRFEAESDEQLQSLKALFAREIKKVDDTITVT